MFFTFVFIAAITGCAHQITISPDVPMSNRGNGVDKISKNVGYYFAPSSREKEVITPGGGGDRVRYNPYNDIEAAFVEMLGNVFKSVTALKSGNDSEISKNSIDYLILLDISTNSSSPSSFTWPPTWFGVNLTSKVSDSTGNNLTSLSVSGDGKAEFGEFFGNQGIAGRRASVDALSKMQNALLKAPELRAPVPTITVSETPTPINGTTSQKLRDLQALRKDDVITEDEFQKKKQQLLEKL